MKRSFRYDVTVSFAGEDRQTVECFVSLLHHRNIRVFYDTWEQADLWGKDLYQHLDSIYKHAARYCIIFVSQHYVRKAWARHELKSAQSRAFEENSEYILPIRLDDTDLPGLSSTVAYFDARTVSLNQICKVLASKLGTVGRLDVINGLNSMNSNDRKMALIEISIEGWSEDFERIIEILESDPADDVREKAAWALDNLNDSRAYPALVRAIHDRSFGVRSAAGWALVHLGKQLVRKDMEEIAQTSNNADAREMAQLVLNNL